MKQNPKPTERPGYSGPTRGHKPQVPNVNNKQSNLIRVRMKTSAGGTQLNKTLPSALVYKPHVSVGEDSLFHPDIYHKPQTRKKYFCDLVDSYMNKKASDNLVPQRKINKKISLINRYQIPEEENADAKSPLSSVKVFKVKRALTAGFSRRVATETSDFKIVGSKDTQYDFAKNAIFSDKKKSRMNSIQNMKDDRIYARNNQADARNQTKLEVMKGYLKSNKNARNYLRRQLIAEERKVKRAQISGNKSISSHNDSQSLEDESGNEEFANAGYFPSIIEHSDSKNDRMDNSRLKTMSKISTSMHAFSTKSKSIRKIIDAKELAELKISTHDMEAQFNKRINLINTKFNEHQWSIKQMHEHALYQVFYLSSSGQGAIHTKPSLKIKKYKQLPEAQKSMNAVEKIKDIKVSHLWTGLPKIEPTSQNMYLSPNAKSLRQEFFVFMKEQKNEGEPLYHIQQTPSYFKLFHNNCEYFRDIIVAVAQDFTKMKGTIISNKISLDNLYRLEEKMIQVGDWGSAAVNRKLVVADKEVVFRDEPNLLIQQCVADQEQRVSTKWLVSPEHLPPQVIQCLIGGVYSRIWEIEGCPEIWSLGIIIYQLLSCVPVSMPHLSTINHRIPKCGIFYDKQKRLTQIFSNQNKMPSIVSKWIRDEKNSPIYKHIHPEIINLMKSMLQLNPKSRPGPEQIISKLRNSI